MLFLVHENVIKGGVSAMAAAETCQVSSRHVSPTGSPHTSAPDCYPSQGPCSTAETWILCQRFTLWVATGRRYLDSAKSKGKKRKTPPEDCATYKKGTGVDRDGGERISQGLGVGNA